MIPTRYFDRIDTPAIDSPIARIMLQLDAIYPDKPAEELRAVANERIRTAGPGRVKWSSDESRRLKEARVLAGSNAAERFSLVAKATPRNVRSEASVSFRGWLNG